MSLLKKWLAEHAAQQLREVTDLVAANPLDLEVREAITSPSFCFPCSRVRKRVRVLEITSYNPASDIPMTLQVTDGHVYLDCMIGPLVHHDYNRRRQSLSTCLPSITALRGAYIIIQMSSLKMIRPSTTQHSFGIGMIINDLTFIGSHGTQPEHNACHLMEAPTVIKAINDWMNTSANARATIAAREKAKSPELSSAIMNEFNPDIDAGFTQGGLEIIIDELPNTFRD
ncbi:hypothetical protein DFS34DRAFT_636526 [Phlyctochytrium arcticum]|nr:hypothetical protein DFS34DRAFT_636526 [Phlyctochytrium arcticum]